MESRILTSPESGASTADGFDVAAQCRHVKVGLALKTRDRRLHHVQALSESDLGHVASVTQFAQATKVGVVLRPKDGLGFCGTLVVVWPGL
jgi:hypothetical protein